MTIAPSSAPNPTDLTMIHAIADRLRQLTQISIQPQWRGAVIGETTPPSAETFAAWPVVTLNDRGHIPWARGQQSLWLAQRITVPPALAGFPLAGLNLKLRLVWWADAAQIYVNGVAVQAGDLFDCFTRVPLGDRVQPGEVIDVAVHLVSPGHDEGALVKSVLIYEAAANDLPEPGFVADELTVLATYAAALKPAAIATLTAAVADLDWAQVDDRDAFQRSVQAMRDRLMPLSPWIKSYQVSCLGHAHLDLAWLWPVEETWDAAERTFRSVLDLQKDFPELTYTHSSPALFAWLADHRPELFCAVQQAVADGRWGIDAGLWVEPELNTLGGESLARQILYGQRYCRDTFGTVSAIAWLPDSFGFSWQLPQLFAQGQVRCFATQKLRWNDTTPFPHELFWWEGLDGTRLLSMTLPPIGSDVDPVAIARHSAQWIAQTQLTESLWLPGVGDHGGGPTRDMLHQARRWAASPFFPAVTFRRAADFLETVERQVAPSPAANGGKRADEGAIALPCWRDELYLELHRGCYTTHGDQKRQNRACETRLTHGERFAAIATLTLDVPYPKAALETAWKQMLFNQFHDILPGTAIPEVFATANETWAAALDTADRVLHHALAQLAGAIALPPAPHSQAVAIALFNPLNWSRSEVVEVALPEGEVPAWQAIDGPTGNPLTTQVSAAGRSLLVEVQDVPAIGYRLLWLVPAAASPSPIPMPAHWQLESDRLRVTLDPHTGDIASLWDCHAQRETLSGPGNHLQAFVDQGEYWDAWNIAPAYADHPLPPATLESITWVEHGPLRQRVRVVRQVGQSTLQQDYVLEARSPYLSIETVADWQECQVVLKTAFPTRTQATSATYEIPFGAIARPLNSDDPHQRAKWEVPALGWADLSDGHHGLSILTDYKHGFDAQPDRLCLTLLKAPLWPDPGADRGHHVFRYAVLPHGGSWQAAQTPHHAIAFNAPLYAQVCPQSTRATGDPAPVTQHSFLHWDSPNLAIAAFKPSEDDPNAYILRCWDAYGKASTLHIHTPLPLVETDTTDLLEDPTPTAIADPLRPWQVVTRRLIRR